MNPEFASPAARASPGGTVPWVGKVLYHVAPFRRGVVLANLRRVFGQHCTDAALVELAQRHYAHLWRTAVEFLSFPFLSAARRATLVRVENIESIRQAHAQGKGVLLLAAHLGNWEVATVAGLGQFPQYRGQFHVVRRPLWPRWLDALVTWRFRRGGFGVLPKKGALDRILDRLAAGDAVIFMMDQHAGGHDGVSVDFFGHPAGTFRSLAIIARATGAPVVPAATWRQPDGTHVVRFEDPLPLVEADDAALAIRANTRAYNAALEQLILRHPEQWFWVHRRWKP
jgi:KDO2-lipid IV(A) lauroyltransferase